MTACHGLLLAYRIYTQSDAPFLIHFHFTHDGHALSKLVVRAD